MGTITPLEHSVSFAPSGFEGAMICTAKSLKAPTMPPLPPEQVTIEGVVAHHVLERCLKTGEDTWEFIGQTFSQGGFDAEVTAEMADDLQEGIGIIRAFIEESGHPPHIEERLQMPTFPKMWGTADFWIRDVKDRITVLDLKYGFILIEPTALQLAIYMIMGILNEFGEARIYDGPSHEFIGVTAVMQPRTFGADRIRQHHWTRAEVQDVYQRILRGAARIERGELVYQAGDHCRYCNVAPACPKLRQVAADAVMAEILHDPEVTLTGAELDENLAMATALKTFIARNEQMAQQYLEAGGKLSSRKLVWKRAARVVSDAEGYIRYLKQHKVDPYLPAALRSPAQAEKALPKSARGGIGKYVTKQSTGLTTAGPDDPRLPVNRTVSDQTRQLAKMAAANITGQ